MLWMETRCDYHKRRRPDDGTLNDQGVDLCYSGYDIAHLGSMATMLEIPHQPIEYVVWKIQKQHLLHQGVMFNTIERFSEVHCKQDHGDILEQVNKSSSCRACWPKCILIQD